MMSMCEEMTCIFGNTSQIQCQEELDVQLASMTYGGLSTVLRCSERSKDNLYCLLAIPHDANTNASQNTNVIKVASQQTRLIIIFGDILMPFPLNLPAKQPHQGRHYVPPSNRPRLSGKNIL